MDAEAGDKGDATSGDAGPTCGDGVLAGQEECDGSNLGDKTCRDLGFDSGNLSCDEDCHFDTGACIQLCGNAVLDPGEDCDGSNLNGRTCQDMGLQPGLLACRPDCRFDLTGCPGCGNGVAEPGEMCDGTDFKGIGCNGTLTCTSDCLLDARGCSLTTSGTGRDGDLLVDDLVDLSQTDAPAFAVASLGVIDVFLQEPAAGLASGDRVVLANLQGCPGACDTVGRWELNMVASVDATRVGLANPIITTFGRDNGNSDLTCQHVVLLRVPNYRSIEIRSGGLLTTAPWDGTKGGLLVLQVSDHVTIESGGRISLDGLGFRGGPGRNGNNLTGWPGESLCGPAAQEGTEPNFGAGGGGRVGGSSQDVCGQGGGGGGFGAPGQTPDFTETCHNRDNGDPADNAGSMYGPEDMSLVLLGSGGGSGATDEHSSTSGAGGSGGGTLFLMADRILVAGSLSADGATGTAGDDTNDSGNGGGGSGGGLFLHLGTIEGTGQVTARGGPGLPAQDQNWNSPGGDGGPGRIRLDFQQAGGSLFDTQEANNWIEDHVDPPPGMVTVTLQ